MNEFLTAPPAQKMRTYEYKTLRLTDTRFLGDASQSGRGTHDSRTTTAITSRVVGSQLQPVRLRYDISSQECARLQEFSVSRRRRRSSGRCNSSDSSSSNNSNSSNSSSRSRNSNSSSISRSVIVVVVVVVALLVVVVYHSNTPPPPLHPKLEIIQSPYFALHLIISCSSQYSTTDVTKAVV